MKNLSSEEFEELYPANSKWPSDFLQVDACSCVSLEFFEDLEETLEKFGLEILMADLGDDSYTFKIIKKGDKKFRSNKNQIKKLKKEEVR